VSDSKLDTSCGCGEILDGGLDRRRFLHLAAVGALTLTLPSLAFGASGDYEAMALTCIDPRFQEPVRTHLTQRGLIGKYSQFTIAGAAIGVVAPAFQDWHKTFWDNLAASVQLHNIKKVIAIDHRDCGAAKIAYGEAKVANRDIETQTHKAVFAEFRQQMAQKQPKLGIEAALIDLDGKVELL
jgi:carbonic anhydrase